MQGSLVSLPYCDAGGPLADSPEIEKQMLLKAMELSVQQKIKTLSVRFTSSFAGIDPTLTRNANKVRLLLTLPDGSEALLASLKAKVRSQVKKPFRDGLTVQCGGRGLLDDFYPLFAENMRDLGSPVHARAWISRILQCFANRAVLFIVRMPDHTPAAGGILLCHPNMVSVPWASSLRRFNRRNPNMMLYWAFLKFAADHQYPMFDFGRSTPGEGTYSFKKQWGAAPSPLHWADFKSAPGPGNYPLQPIPQTAASVTSAASAASGKRKQAEAVIMKMPVSVSRIFGTMTRKYISL